MKAIGIAISFALISGAALAQDCTPEAVIPLANSCKAEGKTDIRDAEAECLATITAPDGYIILEKDIQVRFLSTYEGIKDPTVPQGKQKLTSKPFEGDMGVPDSPLIDNIQALSEVTASAYCDRSAGSRMGKTCYAEAIISAKAYPVSCIKTWLTPL